MTSTSGRALPDPHEQLAPGVVLPPAASKVGHAVAVGVCAVAMLAVGSWGLDRGSLWRDEVATRVAAGRSVSELWAMLHNVDAVHGLYYLGMHAWLKLGDGEVWLRVPSVAASVVSAGLVAALGTRLSGVRVGLVAGLLFAAMPVVSIYAQEARSFAIVTAAVLAATYLLVKALLRGAGWWLAYLATATLAAWTNEIALLALAAHAVTLWVIRVPRGVWWRWTGCAMVCGLSVVPLAWISVAQSGQVGWIQRPDLEILGNLGQLFLAAPVIPLSVTAALVVAGLVLARPDAGLPLAAVAAPLALVPPVLLLMVSFVHPLFHPRYVLYAAAGIPLLAAYGLVRLTSVLGLGWPRRPARRVAGIVITAVVVVGLAATQVPPLRQVRTPEGRPDDLAAAAAVVRAHTRPGDAVIFMPGLYRLVALGYPEAFAGLRDLALLVPPEESDSLAGQELDLAQLEPAMLAVDHLWVVGRPTLVAFPSEEKTSVKQAVLRAYFYRAQVIRVRGVDVALYRKITR